MDIKQKSRIGSPNTVIITSVTTIVLIESVHQRSLYFLTKVFIMLNACQTLKIRK